jgi:flagellar protein FlbD
MTTQGTADGTSRTRNGSPRTRTDDAVIILTRLGGHELAVNPDLIERAEATPDTVLTMVDGHKIVVVEPVEEVVDLMRTWRATVAAQAFTLARAAADLGTHQLDDASALTAIDATLARVLRLPQRKE